MAQTHNQTLRQCEQLPGTGLSFICKSRRFLAAPASPLPVKKVAKRTLLTPGMQIRKPEAEVKNVEFFVGLKLADLPSRRASLAQRRSDVCLSEISRMAKPKANLEYA